MNAIHIRRFGMGSQGLGRRVGESKEGMGKPTVTRDLGEGVEVARGYPWVDGVRPATRRGIPSLSSEGDPANHVEGTITDRFG